ncbi:MAG: DJ-1/PfpI family protein [Desulfarculus sp.]|nr:MAG: DJ-1/PfpI family protein [Desulfarculus sp.]
MGALRKVAILIFDDVEVLDFCGPFEVFAVSGAYDAKRLCEVYTVAQKTPVLARNGLSINPTYDLAHCPPPEVLVVPGGLGTRQEMHNQELIAWIKVVAAGCQVVLSVCTGALLLAQAGLLRGLAATTHHRALDLLAQVAPDTELRPAQRLVDNGRVVTAAVISAGIDASLHVLARLLGPETAQQTATYMEYDWSPQPAG